jgi:FlaA1/EpsC-like NDP-sugar epimerase
MGKKEIIFKIILFLGDIFLMYLALILTLGIRIGDFSQLQDFFFHFSFFYFFWLLFLFSLDFYELPPFKKNFEFFRNLIIFFFLAGISGVIYFYLQPQLVFTPKTILFLDALIFSLFVLLWRIIFQYILKLQNFKEKIGIIGIRQEFFDLLNKLEESHYQIVVFYLPDEDKKYLSLSQLAKYGIVDNLFQLKEIIKKEKLKSIVLILDSQIVLSFLIWQFYLKPCVFFFKYEKGNFYFNFNIDNFWLN